MYCLLPFRTVARAQDGLTCLLLCMSPNLCPMSSHLGTFVAEKAPPGTSALPKFSAFAPFAVVAVQNDEGGHDNVHHDQLFVYVGRGFGICTQYPDHVDQFYNNKVIMTVSLRCSHFHQRTVECCFCQLRRLVCLPAESVYSALLVVCLLLPREIQGHTHDMADFVHWSVPVVVPVAVLLVLMLERAALENYFGGGKP